MMSKLYYVKEYTVYQTKAILTAERDKGSQIFQINLRPGDIIQVSDYGKLEKLNTESIEFFGGVSPINTTHLVEIKDTSKLEGYLKGILAIRTMEDDIRLGPIKMIERTEDVIKNSKNKDVNTSFLDHLIKVKKRDVEKMEAEIGNAQVKLYDIAKELVGTENVASDLISYQKA
ncbi:hypothetical protein M2146_001109 [Lachnospiraceae bacterium PF1-22]